MLNRGMNEFEEKVNASKSYDTVLFQTNSKVEADKFHLRRLEFLYYINESLIQ